MIDTLPNSDKVKRMLRNSFFMRNVLLIKPDLIIHVGADKGSDREEYSKLGAKKVIWLEADPENVNYLRKTYPDDQTISGIVSNEETFLLDGELSLKQCYTPNRHELYRF